MPTRSVELHVDVTDAAGLGEPAHIAITVTVPAEPPPDPVVCFAKPGAGYGRGYYAEDLPGPGRGAQADWHAARGWIFVSVDHLGVGDSSLHDPERLSFAPVVAASQAAESEVRRRLASGTLVDRLGPVANALTIGIGQSMGGAFTVVQQGRYHGYDGVGVLGYSPLRTQPPTGPGLAPLPLPWVPRDTQLSDGVVTNAPALAAGSVDQTPPAEAIPMAWGFHYDDVADDVVRRDLEDYPARHGDVPPWGSATIPATAVLWCLAPGSTLAEAAAIRCPVLVAMGERDVLVDPRGELRAYESASSVDFFTCPRMAHMHNFAGTRELFWRRIETWAEWVRAVRDQPRPEPS
jgi:alpha-beta hydrolase superfamily lysophospholipase